MTPLPSEFVLSNGGAKLDRFVPAVEIDAAREHAIAVLRDETRKRIGRRYARLNRKLDNLGKQCESTERRVGDLEKKVEGVSEKLDDLIKTLNEVKTYIHLVGLMFRWTYRNRRAIIIALASVLGGFGIAKFAAWAGGTTWQQWVHNLLLNWAHRI